MVHTDPKPNRKAHVDIFHLNRQRRGRTHLLVAVFDSVIQQYGKQAETDNMYQDSQSLLNLLREEVL